MTAEYDGLVDPSHYLLKGTQRYSKVRLESQAARQCEDFLACIVQTLHSTLLSRV